MNPVPRPTNVARIKRIRRALVDLVLAGFAYPAGLLLRRARRAWRYAPLTRKALDAAGVLPLRRHFYEPVVAARDLRRPLSDVRTLPGLDLNVSGQLEVCSKLRYAAELVLLPLQEPPLAQGRAFFFNNGSFEGADAGFFYSVIRHFKPKRIVEIGAGYSTLLARRAVERNVYDDAAYSCRHICIEPYLKPWLESTGAEIVRSRAEFCDFALFDALEANDILFIDSSHVIRPQGDVLFEVLELLGRLKGGVFVHIHDIFTPRDYPADWVLGDQRLWSEQYLIEAFLAFNAHFTITAALNCLYHDHQNALAAVCPIMGSGRNVEPRSLWIQKRG